eukprot:CAMPEP_0119155154 /NCGR_PEP_ID=MMETSP1310-20130426/51600_1 /TAXON_ID=464262 /ORGANISM="Genus nov. species nov., Strain RCC2339" /LENGTH=1011 /DNA_ID=CAMNT_0007147741 /DNA_START=162 /DNA_END=3194 /DNA_ORIENTATION=+
MAQNNGTKTIFEGFLRRQRGNEKWEMRWFVLKENCLEYYESRGSKKPRGTIAIGLTTSVELPRVVHRNMPDNMFYISDPKKTTAVCAETNKSMAAWMTILRKACAGGVSVKFTRQVSSLLEKDATALRKEAHDEDLKKAYRRSTSKKNLHELKSSTDGAAGVRARRLQQMSRHEDDEKVLLKPKRVIRFFLVPEQKRAVAVNGSTSTGKFLCLVARKLDIPDGNLALWALPPGDGTLYDSKGRQLPYQVHRSANLMLTLVENVTVQIRQGNSIFRGFDVVGGRPTEEDVAHLRDLYDNKTTTFETGVVRSQTNVPPTMGGSRMPQVAGRVGLASSMGGGARPTSSNRKPTLTEMKGEQAMRSLPTMGSGGLSQPPKREERPQKPQDRPVSQAKPPSEYLTCALCKQLIPVRHVKEHAKQCVLNSTQSSYQPQTRNEYRYSDAPGSGPTRARKLSQESIPTRQNSAAAERRKLEEERLQLEEERARMQREREDIERRRREYENRKREEQQKRDEEARRNREAEEQRQREEQEQLESRLKQEEARRNREAEEQRRREEQEQLESRLKREREAEQKRAEEEQRRLEEEQKRLEEEQKRLEEEQKRHEEEQQRLEEERERQEAEAAKAAVAAPSAGPSNNLEEIEASLALPTATARGKKGDLSTVTKKKLQAMGVIIPGHTIKKIPAPAKRNDSDALAMLMSTLDETGSQSSKGKRIDDYCIEKQVGRGAFGIVYKAKSVKDGSLAAVKTLDLADKQLDKQAVVAELAVLKDFDHQNIVSLHKCVRTKESLHIIMEFVEGGSLLSILKKFGHQPEEVCRDVMRQMLMGLAFLHSRRVVHRDIKCANILLQRGGVIKLSDFGIATSKPKEDDVTGSPYWMAPEIIELKGASWYSDIWSVGATIIELLTGEPPFFSLNRFSAMHAIVDEPSPVLKIPHTPHLRDFLARCFQKNPKQRPAAVQLLRHPWITTATLPIPKDAVVPFSLALEELSEKNALALSSAEDSDYFTDEEEAVEE